MQVVSATWIVIYIAMLNWSLNKIFNGFQIRIKIHKIQNFIEIKENHKILEIREKLNFEFCFSTIVAVFFVFDYY